MVRFKKYLEVIVEEDLVENASVVGSHLLSRISALQQEFPETISNARGKGLFCAIDVPTTEIRTRLLSKILEKGVIMLPCGEKSIRFRPPLIISNAQIDEGIDVIEKSIREL
jgi:L-lysine 6-transaminase